MSVTQVLYKPGCEVSYDIEKGYTLTRRAKVVCDTSEENIDNVIDALPAVGSSFSDSQLGTISSARLRSISYSKSGKNTYDVTLSYETDVANQTDNPVSDPPEYSLSQEELVVYPERDYSGQPFLNSAGERLNPGIPVTLYIQVVSVTKNYGYFPLDVAKTFSGAVNSKRFWGFQPGKVLCSGISCNSQNVRNGVVFFRTTFTFKIHPLVWSPTYVLDRGTRWKDDEGKVHDILVDGQPVKEPVNLDGNGKPFPPGHPKPYHFLEFHNYKQVDFNVLRI